MLDQSISAAEMRTAPVALCVAAAMACFHYSELAVATSSCVAGPLRAIVWPRLRTWAGVVAGLYSPAELAELRLSAVASEVRTSSFEFCRVMGQFATAKVSPASVVCCNHTFDTAFEPQGCTEQVWCLEWIQVDVLEAACSSGAAALLGFCHNDLQVRRKQT